MGSISVQPELEEKLAAIGIPMPNSLEVEYYFNNPVGPGQLGQFRLSFKPKWGLWEAGRLNHDQVGASLNVDGQIVRTHRIWRQRIGIILILYCMVMHFTQLPPHVLPYTIRSQLRPHHVRSDDRCRCVTHHI